MPFACSSCCLLPRHIKNVDELLVEIIDANLLRTFLRPIKEKRQCSISSRNQRLAAIHALGSFIAERCPEYLDWCVQLRTVNSKRSAPTPVCYLEKPEIDALLDAPNPATTLGYRDGALMYFLYNSGARADEVTKLSIEDLRLHSGADGALSSVCLHDKGGKVRVCPLWASTTAILRNLVAGRSGKKRVFLIVLAHQFADHSAATVPVSTELKLLPNLNYYKPRDWLTMETIRCKHLCSSLCVIPLT
jgi:integrase/recombinase XerD